MLTTDPLKPSEGESMEHLPKSQEPVVGTQLTTNGTESKGNQWEGKTICAWLLLNVMLQTGIIFYSNICKGE